MYGEIIKNLRLSYNLSQVQLANELNVSKQTISNWENNNILPSIEMLIKLSLFFSVSTDYLLEQNQRENFMDGYKYAIRTLEDGLIKKR